MVLHLYQENTDFAPDTCESGGRGKEDGGGAFVTTHPAAIARLPASLQLLDSNATIEEKLPSRDPFQSLSTEGPFGGCWLFPDRVSQIVWVAIEEMKVSRTIRS